MGAEYLYPDGSKTCFHIYLENNKLKIDSVGNNPSCSKSNGLYCQLISARGSYKIDDE